MGAVDLRKLRLCSGDSGVGQSACQSTEPLSSPEWDEFPFTEMSGGMIHGFCCATFPLAKGLTKSLKRL
ncbi:hypothetical protein DPMN_139160 [Dreissena polymorpha]|uniref:Uncharacterized protein n=1 Tax=Dreissena polymorpha TaxID=45954 RepID=A0A9D4G8N0_DREPO|nr:hypothetical protein DPMN_139160 [Dreissena polymorpha]